MRRVAIGLLAAFVLGVAAIAAGVRFNGTPSFPEGLYLTCGKVFHRGDLVFVSLPLSLCT
jgi:type IV secretory pathway protease TraF